MWCCVVVVCCVFLVKKTTAYVLPISDWSSDVCSSYLTVVALRFAGSLTSAYPLSEGRGAGAAQSQPHSGRASGTRHGDVAVTIAGSMSRHGDAASRPSIMSALLRLDCLRRQESAFPHR